MTFKQILLKAFDKLLENLVSVKVWVLALATWFRMNGRIDKTDWMIVAGSFLTSKILEYVINRRKKPIG
jgi:hypothetical protein